MIPPGKPESRTGGRNAARPIETLADLAVAGVIALPEAFRLLRELEDSRRSLPEDDVHRVVLEKDDVGKTLDMRVVRMRVVDLAETARQFEMLRPFVRFQRLPWYRTCTSCTSPS